MFRSNWPLSGAYDVALKDPVNFSEYSGLYKVILSLLCACLVDAFVGSLLYPFGFYRSTQNSHAQKNSAPYTPDDGQLGRNM